MMLYTIVFVKIKIWNPICIDSCRTLVVLVLTVIDLPPMYLVELLIAAIELILSTKGVFICDLLTLLLRINFHMSMIKGYNHGGISHHLPIPTDTTPVMQKMGTSIRIEAGINFYHMIILGSAGDLHFHQSLVILAFCSWSSMFVISFFFLDVVNPSLSSLSGPCYPDDSRMGRSPMSFSGPPREPPYPNNRWDFPPQPLNHRHFNYRPSAEGPVPVANRGVESIPVWRSKA